MQSFVEIDMAGARARVAKLQMDSSNTLIGQPQGNIITLYRALFNTLINKYVILYITYSILYVKYSMLYHTYSILTSKYKIQTFPKNQPSILGHYF